MPHPGEIWVADIRFTNGLSSKIRPVLILWLDSQDAVVAAVTSSPVRSSTDVHLEDWASEGLRVPSTVRLSRLDSLEQILLQRRLGTLTTRDALAIKTIWKEAIHLHF